MKIFIDSGETKDIKEAHNMGLIDGVTTNPSLAAKSGKPFKQLIMEITEIVDGPISAEVVSVTAPEMIVEGEGLAAWHKNIVVKVPLIPEGLKAVKVLTAKGINIARRTVAKYREDMNIPSTHQRRRRDS